VTEDREKYVKILSGKIENGKVMIRKVRGDEMHDIKKQFEAKEITEDRNPDGKREHPTQKPVRVMIWTLNFVPSATSILDPFMGSGTTAVAAKNLGRKYIGIDVSPEYCQMAEERIKKGHFNGKKQQDLLSLFPQDCSV